MKHLTVLTAVAVAVATLAPPASASSVAYCARGASVTGEMTYDNPISGTSRTQHEPVTWTLELILNCRGTDPATGTYELQIVGSGVESCVTGSGSGVVQYGGLKYGTFINDGRITGGDWHFTRVGHHYAGVPPLGDGSLTVVTWQYDERHTFTMRLSLDLESLAGAVPAQCPGAGGAVTGLGVIST